MIDQRLVQSALEAVDTTNFERFAQAFYGAVQDREFIPLGGVHDGGAEGFDATDVGDPEIFEDETATSFIQVSKQATTRKKIRDTVKRLLEYGRNPRVLTYITSRVVADIDKEEALLSKELGCKIAIRDAKYIEVYINSNGATQGAFYSYLQPSISHLFSPGVADMGTETDKHVDRTLAVFLRQEVDNRGSRSGLMESIADSLIIWALRDTDPDPAKRKLVGRAEILARIEAALPTSKAFMRGSLDHRLQKMAAKDAPGGRMVRHYRKSDEFCLPYETRTIVAIENADDDLLKMQVSCVFEDRLSGVAGATDDSLRAVIVKVCHAALEKVFEHQGLQLAQFVQNSEQDDELYTDVAAFATTVIDTLDVTAATKEYIRRTALFILRGTFYSSTDIERRYLGKLSRTYVLMLLLKNDPKVVQYFSSMAGKFSLYVGTDIIVRALSELYLEPESQTTVNLLKILKAAGSTLILSEKTVEEAATHIRRQIFEYENAYEANDSKITVELVEYIDRLLIRAYFYSNLCPVGGIAPPKNWRAYVSQFCNYGDVRENKGDHELADYLMRKFGFTYESTAVIEKGIDKQQVNELAADIQAVRERGGRVRAAGGILAYNDALQVLRIYNRRSEYSETSPGNPFGFQTWWMTQDSKVRRGSARAISAHGGQQFMLRPEFLLNYIGLSPSLAAVHQSFETIFPSALGVRLSSGIKTEDFEKVMRDAAELAAVDDARAGAMITALTNKLKGDQIKAFEKGW
ncbi:MAG: hypothetical protein V4808_01750 [Pseudomonadota bacterium]